MIRPEQTIADGTALVRVGFISKPIDLGRDETISVVCAASMSPRSLWVSADIASQFAIVEMVVNGMHQAGIGGEVVCSQFESERHVEGNLFGAPILLDDVPANTTITIKIRKIGGVPGQYARFIAVLFGEPIDNATT